MSKNSKGRPGSKVKISGKEYMSITHASMVHGVSPQAVHRWIKTGKAVRI